MGKCVYLWEIVWVTLISFGEKNYGKLYVWGNNFMGSGMLSFLKPAATAKRFDIWYVGS